MAVAYYDGAEWLPMWTSDQARFYVRDTLEEHQYNAAELSRRLNHAHTYLNQYFKQRKPEWLGETEREALCKMVPELDERKLRKPSLDVSATNPTSRKGRHQAQIDAEPPNKLEDDPSILQLIDAYRAIRDEEGRTLILTMAKKLAAASGAIVA